jgi:hypothetical protein
MKNIVIQVPRNGAVHLVLRSGASSGQAVIVASDDVEVSYLEGDAVASPKSQLRDNNRAPSSDAKGCDLDEILKRLLKLRVTKRTAAINSIKAMFQFDAPIADEGANKILNNLIKRGSLTIDANDKIRFRAA